MDTLETLQQIAQSVAGCQKCPLHQKRIRAVPGEGPASAEIMLIGEGPGRNEDEQGRPFVGNSGRFLTELLAKAGLKRSDVFICNVVKCRPPENRDPEPAEILACRPYLEAQITALNPKVIITLGRHSMGHFLSQARISVIHGRPVKAGGRLIIPMYHPAAALHQPALKDDLLADFARVPAILANGGTLPPEPAPAPAALPASPEPAISPPPTAQPALPEKKDEGLVQLTLF
ncbi:MAG TPA: uracil-DNA glycosylase [Anaerolineaceae bacterium]|nr:uracil-DNA glycosylase [Anaerolineaceae bacterium]HPN52457.1 uracil-DNA glycosylase [Anaerolineaceae bacterium]